MALEATWRYRSLAWQLDKQPAGQDCNGGHTLQLLRRCAAVGNGSDIDGCASDAGGTPRAPALRIDACAGVPTGS